MKLENLLKFAIPVAMVSLPAAVMGAVSYGLCKSYQYLVDDRYSETKQLKLDGVREAGL